MWPNFRHQSTPSTALSPPQLKSTRSHPCCTQLGWFPVSHPLRCWTVFQKRFGAAQQSFSMASPNSSHTRCFASVTAAAAGLRACRLPLPLVSTTVSGGCCSLGHLRPYGHRTQLQIQQRKL